MFFPSLKRDMFSWHPATATLVIVSNGVPSWNPWKHPLVRLLWHNNLPTGRIYRLCIPCLLRFMLPIMFCNPFWMLRAPVGFPLQPVWDPPSGCNCSLAKVVMTSFGSSRARPSSLATTWTWPPLLLVGRWGHINALALIFDEFWWYLSNGPSHEWPMPARSTQSLA